MSAKRDSSVPLYCVRSRYKAELAFWSVKGAGRESNERAHPCEWPASGSFPTLGGGEGRLLFSEPIHSKGAQFIQHDNVRAAGLLPSIGPPSHMPPGSDPRFARQVPPLARHP